jgi:hypothetical protein
MKPKLLFYLILPVVLLIFACSCSGETARPISSGNPSVTDSVALPSASIKPAESYLSASPSASSKPWATDLNASLLIYQFKNGRIIAPDGTEYEFFSPCSIIDMAILDLVKIGYIEGVVPTFNEYGFSWPGIYVTPNDPDKTTIMYAKADSEWPIYYRKVGAAPMEIGPLAVDYVELFFYDEQHKKSQPIVFDDKNILQEFFSDILAQQDYSIIRENISYSFGQIRGYYDEDKWLYTDFFISSYQNNDFTLGFSVEYNERFTPISITRLIPPKWVEYFGLREHYAE